MPQPLPIIAQYAMDAYYQAYKSASQFFDIQDFVFHCGATIADIYQQEARLKYNELRSTKSEDVVGFPADWLLEQKLKVDRKDNVTFATLDKPVMGFSWDNQVLGVQEVLPAKPRDVVLERTTQAAEWQNRHLPFTHRIFWYVRGNKIFFYNKGGCNINEITVLYIPSISSETTDALVPDGIVKMAIDQTVGTMRQLAQATVEKKGVDGQGQNKTIETEMNKMALK